MKNKKVLGFVLFSCFLLTTLTGCNNQKNKEQNQNSQNNQKENKKERKSTRLNSIHIQKTS